MHFPMLATSAMNLKRINFLKNSELKKEYTSLVFQWFGLSVFSMWMFLSKLEVLRILK